MGSCEGRFVNGLKFIGIFMCKILIVVVLLVVVLFLVLVDVLSYIYVEGGWIQVQVDDNVLDDLKVDGGYLCGLVVLVEQVYVFGGWLCISKICYYGEDLLKLELNQLELGIGYYMLWIDCVDFIVDVVWVCQNVELILCYDGVCYYGKDYINLGCVIMGIRGKLLCMIEVWVKVGYMDGGNNYKGIWVGIVGGQINFIKIWGLVGEIFGYCDVIQYLVGVCVSF